MLNHPMNSYLMVMKYISTVIMLLMLCNNTACAQISRGAFEVKPFMRIDWYPSFSYRINPVTDNKVKIRGASYGISANYKYPIKKVNLNIGLGYYKYAFNNINQENSLFGNNNKRTIEYTPLGPIAPSITYATDKYWYHSISISLGVQKNFDLQKDWKLSAGIYLSNYFTFSQSYHIRDFWHKTQRLRYFGFSSSMELGFIKKMKTFSAGPVLILPLFDLWKQDDNFPKNENELERNNATRDKLFTGIGFGFSVRFPVGRK